MITVEALALTGKSLPAPHRDAEQAVRELIAMVYPETPYNNLFEHVPGVLLLAKPEPDSSDILGIANIRSEAPRRLSLPNTAWIDTLVVTPTARRSEDTPKQYIGTRLAERALSIANMQDVASVALEAVRESEVFWDAQGFRPIPEQPGQLKNTTLLARTL